MLRILAATIISCGGEFGLTGRVHSFVYFLLKEGSIVMFGGVVWLGSRNPIGVEVFYCVLV